MYCPRTICILNNYEYLYTYMCSVILCTHSLCRPYSTMSYYVSGECSISQPSIHSNKYSKVHACTMKDTAHHLTHQIQYNHYDQRAVYPFSTSPFRHLLVRLISPCSLCLHPPKTHVTGQVGHVYESCHEWKDNTK